MVVGILQVRLTIYESTSLKDKRRVLKSLKDRLRQRFNISVAEIGALEARQAAELGATLIANDARFVEGELQSVLNFIEKHRGASLVDYDVELL